MEKGEKKTMGERRRISDGSHKKYLAEIILTMEQDKKFDEIREQLTKRSGYAPQKWQLNTLIFVEGMMALEKKFASNIKH